MRLLVSALVGFFGIVPVYWVLSHFIDPALAGAAACAVGLVGLPTLVLVFWKPKTGIEEAAARGALITERYTVKRAVEVEEFEDEGRHFFLALTDGRTLFLTGQQLYEPCESGAFPKSSLSIRWDKQSGYTLSIQSRGDPIPVEVCPGFSLPVIRAGIPDDRQLFSEDVSVVLARYGINVARPGAQAELSA